MHQRICLACYGDRLATLLETATTLYVVELGNAMPHRVHAVPIPHRGVGLLVRLVVAERATALVCGGICARWWHMLQSAGITVLPWLSGSVDAVCEGLSRNSLDHLAMPGCNGNHSQRNRPQNVPYPSEGEHMKVIITTKGPTPDSELDPRFGRAAVFLVYDTQAATFHALDVAATRNLAQGAGIQAAQAVADAGATAVITGHVGPKAFMALERGGIAIHLSSHRTAREALQAFSEGQLARASQPDREGHW